MAKQVYKIPESLDKSPLDMELSLQTKSGLGGKPLKLKVLGAYIFSALIGFWFVTNTFIADGGIGIQILFAILWFALTLVLFMPDKVGNMKVELLEAMTRYFPASRRHIVCRTDSPAGPFWGLTGIEKIDDKSGVIEMSDGSVAMVCMIVGSASVLLFDQDRDDILNRVDAYWRKVTPECEHIFVTTREAQRVVRQIGWIDRRFKHLKVKDPDLVAVANMQLECLREYVGKSFRSLHQYLILKAENREQLDIAFNILRSECENSTLVFKRCAIQYGDDIYSVFRTVYQGEESV